MLSFGRSSNCFKKGYFSLQNPFSFKFTQEIVHLNFVIFCKKGMRVQNLHDISIELFSDFSIGTIFQSFFRCHIDEQSLILQNSQFIFKNGDPLHKFFALDFEFLVDGNILNNDISEILPPGIELMMTTLNRFFGNFPNINKPRIRCNSNILRSRFELAGP